MIKELEALQRLRDLVENLTRITALRNEVKELLIYSYEASNGYFSQIEKALKRNESMKVDPETLAFTTWGDFYNCPNCWEPVRLYDNYCSLCGKKLDWSEKIKKERSNL